ncbi:hypothetical protein [Gracilimonas sp. BCB1]|uniref:hypothetical protein n=1 Tax=Gracilimonas sp. BCB1 TaxID=3152362 RepID=UPI0032D8D70B
MSSIKAEIQYPKNFNTYRIHALSGQLSITRVSSHEEKGNELYLLEVDDLENQKDEGKKLRIEVRRELMEEMVNVITELFEVEPESHFKTSDGKTFYFHKPETKQIEL